MSARLVEVRVHFRRRRKCRFRGDAFRGGELVGFVEGTRAAVARMRVGGRRSPARRGRRRGGEGRSREEEGRSRVDARSPIESRGDPRSARSRTRVAAWTRQRWTSTFRPSSRRRTDRDPRPGWRRRRRRPRRRRRGMPGGRLRAQRGGLRALARVRGRGAPEGERVEASSRPSALSGARSGSSGRRRAGRVSARGRRRRAGAFDATSVVRRAFSRPRAQVGRVQPARERRRARRSRARQLGEGVAKRRDVTLATQIGAARETGGQRRALRPRGYPRRRHPGASPCRGAAPRVVDKARLNDDKSSQRRTPATRASFRADPRPVPVLVRVGTRPRILRRRLVSRQYHVYDLRAVQAVRLYVLNTSGRSDSSKPPGRTLPLRPTRRRRPAPPRHSPSRRISLVVVLDTLADVAELEHARVRSELG